MNRLLVSCVVLFAMLAVAPAAPAKPVDPVAVSARACTITGTAGPNRLGGTAHSDVLCGLGGADRLRGNGGSDLLRGGGGGDLLQGRKGADRLDGGAGDDKAFGGAGADDLRGGRDDDGLGGGFGPDRLSGGPGRDVALYGQRGRSVRVTIGKGANDGVRGEHDNVRGDVEDVRGGRGKDVLIGNGAANELFGGGGRDRLVGNGGNDLLDAGGGNDRIDARDGAAAAARAAQAASVDRVVCGAGEDTAFVDPEDVVDPGCEHVFGAPQNHPPTGITLSNASVAENEPVGTTVGTLSAGDPDPGDTPSFALVPGAGSTDNGSFQIVGSQLRTAAVFNYEAKHTYTVRIRATDHGTPAGQIVRAFTINVSDANEAPTGLTLSNDTLAENEPVGTDVGTLSVSDVDAGQTHTFALVTGTGDADNGKFAITGSTLETAQVLDFEAQQSYSIRVRATDNGTPALSVDAVVPITVTNTLEPPTADDKSATTPEDTPVTITLSAADPEGDDPLTFTTGTASHGSVGAIGPVTCDHLTPNACTADVVFTPDANYNGLAGFSYTASDGAHLSPPATVSITVDPVNDTPVALPGSRSTPEDTPLTLNLDALASDVETSDANLTYEIVGQPTHGTATATTYTPNANFNGTDSLTYKVTDRGDPDNCTGGPPACDAPKTSTTETVSITVDPVNDTPTAPDGARTTDEDTPVALDLASLVSDVETANGNLTYTIVTQPTHGTATPTTYTPSADFNGTDTVTYSVTDRGDPDNCGAPVPGCDGPETSTVGTVTITVSAVNDAPVNTVPAGPVVAPLNVDTPITGVSIADVDAATDAVQLTLSVTNGTLSVNTAVLGGIGTLNAVGNGTNTVVITAPLANINTTLADPNGLVYNGAVSGPDPVTVHTDDLGHNGSGGAKTDTDTIPLIVDSTPVAADQSVTTNEDTPKTITLSASDADGDALTFAIGTGTTNGVLGPIGSVTCGVTPNVCTANVTYTPDANYNGPDSFTFTAADAFTSSAPATVSITVNPVNDPPTLQNIEAGALAYTENDPATLITSTTTVTDVDSANFDTGTLTVDFATGGTVDDRLEIVDQGQIAVSGSNVTFGGTTIGTFTGGTGTTPLVVTLNANSTAAATEALVRAVAFRNVSEAPSTAARTVRLVLTDGDGGTSAPATRSVAVTAVDDPPTLAGIEATPLAYTENDPPTAITSTLTVTDPDSNITGATVSISNNFAAAQDALGFVNQLGITGTYNAATGVLTLTGSVSPANYQTALRAVTYSNSSDNPSTATRTVTFAVQGGVAPATRNVTVTPVNDPPVADDESFSAADSAVGNTALVGNDPTDGAPAQSGPKKTITADILAGDTDAEGQTLVVVPESKATNDGGHVTIEADGDFVFTPAPATSCTDHSDFFDYTVSDQNATGPGPTPGTDTGRVTIAITGCVWYVSNNAAGNSGTSDAPFDTVAQAEAASGANDTVFVFDGDNTSTGYGGNGYTMDAGERLIGEHEGLVVGADTLQPPNPGAKPTLTATNADVIDLNSGNEVRGFVLDPNGTGGGIAGGAGDAGGTIDDVDITDTGTAGAQAGLELNGTTGTFTITNLTVNNSATGVLLNNAGTADFGTTTITTAGAKGLDATGTNMSTSTFDGITVTGSGNGGVSLTNTTGSTAFGNLALTTTGGTGFLLSNAGTVSVPSAGTDNLSATGGPAVDVTGTSGATLAFDDVDSTNSANDGINLAGLGTGTFSAASGGITGAAGIAFDLDGGSGTVTYPGNLNNGTGASAEITNRTGGAVTLSGAIADNADAGGGISVSGNTGGSTTFSNASKVLNTTTSDAVSFTGSDGHTLNLTGGGLNVDTTSGRGIFASNSGTLAVADTGNTIDSTTGTALSVTNTDIGASGATFQSISAGAGTSAGSGPANGIVLNGTGSSGGLTVTGDGTNTSVGGNATGGTISNATGADGATSGSGVYLNSTSSVALRRMTINGTNQNYGIRGNGVSDFTLEYSTVGGTNGTAASLAAPENYGEGAVFFGNATANGTTGNVTLTNNSITGGRARDFSLVNTSPGTTNLTVKGNTLGAMQNFADGNQCFAVEARVSSGVVINTTFGGTNPGEGNTVNNCVSDNVNFTGQDNTTMDVAFRNNALSNNNPTNIIGGGNLVLATKGTMTTHVTGNTMRDANGSAVTLFKASAGTGTPSLSSFFANNTIGVAGTVDSGSKSGNGIFVSAGGTGTMSYTIANNAIHQIHGNAHIYADNTGGSYTANFTITGNTLDGAQPPNWFAGIAVTNGSPTSADTVNVCAKIGGSTVAEKNTLNLGGGLGIIVGSSGAAAGHTFNLPGLSTFTEPGVETFLSTNNTGSFTTDAYADGPATFAAFTGSGTGCPTPSS